MTQRERRRAPRVHADFPIQLADSGGQARPAILRDLSEIGLRCVFPAEVEELTQVRVALQLPGQSNTLEVNGAIVRCDKMPQQTGAPNAWEVAIYFTEVPAGAATSLRGWIDKRVKASGEAAASS